VQKLEVAGPSIANYERFVYADVLVEPNGMPLTVISALSRGGLDPWAEARRLAQLSPLLAADGLAQTLRALPAVQSARVDAKTIASSLVELLPQTSAVSQAVQSGITATPIQLPRKSALVALGFLVALSVTSLLAPSMPDTIAPASWLSEGAAASAKPTAAPIQPPANPAAAKAPAEAARS
jgi:hypothetical protein